MKQKSKNKLTKGFTLIELLVVVLIIGVLASIAVTQYKRAVIKSQAGQALSILQSLQQSYKSYYMAANSWARRFEYLDLTIPWTGNTKWKSNLDIDVLSNEDWSIQLQIIGPNSDLPIPVIYIGRLTGEYKGYAFAYFFEGWGRIGSEYIPANTIACVEQTKGETGVRFLKKKGDFCKKIMGSTNIIQGGDTTTFYDLP